MPHLLDLQTKSYEWFCREGLKDVFADISPIEDSAHKWALHFGDYYFGKGKYNIEQCKAKDVNYSAPLYVKVRLENKETGELKEHDLFMGDFPVMTDTGTFIINGAERVIVSQLVRSPGVYYKKERDAFDKEIYSAQLIPNRGAWIELESDPSGSISVRIDRNRKMPVTVLVRALGYSSNEEILDLFDHDIHIERTLEKDNTTDRKSALIEIYHKLRPGEPATEESGTTLLNNFFYDPRRYDLAKVGRYKLNKKLAWKNRLRGHKTDGPIVNTETGEVVIEANSLIDDDAIARIEESGVFSSFDQVEVMTQKDDGTPVKVICSSGNREDNYRILERCDIIACIDYLLNMMQGYGRSDDIDHLGNRRVRCVGELLQNQFRIGLTRMERVVRERMTTQDQDKMTPQALVNIRPVVAAIKEFFGSSQLSQFMDQTNPLAELTHKRRLSALGPGGLSRERAGFEVRDVHYSHYGRMCPVETPEGPNIGLISSLSNYGIINKYGLIETPYRIIEKSEDPKTGVKEYHVTDETKYVTADIEEDKIIAQASEPLDAEGHFIHKNVASRRGPDVLEAEPEEVDLMDVSPKQVVSIGTSLIPFLEHDDTNRALMGANMQRQAVPLLRPEAPLVGTGMEWVAGQDSGVCILAKRGGTVERVTGRQIIVRADNGELDTYDLIKFMRSNQSTCINQRPTVFKGERVEKGDTLADGMATDQGELALGHNVLVAFVSWEGYNHEDAVLISERLCKDDLYTSIHIEEYECDARDTKLGEEEITRQLSSVSEDAVKYLDENGIIMVGADVRPGDILVGKVTPKGETELTPEERLLRAIFGDKAGDVKDSSLKANPSLSGVVIDKKLFSRAVKTRESKKQDKVILAKIDEEYEAKNDDLKDILVDKLLTLTEGKASQGVKDYSGAEIITKGTKFTATMLKNLEYDGIQSNDWTGDEHTDKLISKLIMNYIRKYKLLDAELKRKKFAITIGDELPSGILQMAKVYVAKKRKIGVGDKLAGRHGNKGIVSKITRMEDMPFLEDGRPVDLVLNPLGVPSRMNLGQIFEAILGAAGRKLGVKFATPIFDGAHLEDLSEWTDKAGLPHLCSTHLYDGETGERFDQPATVGVTYFLKLGHMVEDKMHARSIGPYSLITQQPLGGKAQFGGQRFGEMEVWAIEAFGASHVLQEILTIKSDDTVGRSKAYEAIVKGDPMPTPGIPESLNVLLHELRGLGLSIKLD